MIKVAHVIVAALALGAFTSQTASATTICETEVPKATTVAAGKRNFQNLSICAATNDGKATGTVVKGSGSETNGSGGYFLQVDRIAGSAGGNAKIHIVDAIVGNIVPGCTVTDSTIGGTPPFTNCTTSLTQQLYMYVIAN